MATLLTPNAPAQCLPNTIVVQKGDACVPPSLAFGIRECKENQGRQAAVGGKKQERLCTPFTIVRAEMVSDAHFWWLGALSNKNRP